MANIFELWAQDFLLENPSHLSYLSEDMVDALASAWLGSDVSKLPETGGLPNRAEAASDASGR